MKLISLYIENFGGLSQYPLEFGDGVTVIREANGFGKTTLAEFIRAMFYGFPRKGKFLDKDRRQKYTPWNGAKAGGNLTFGYEGNQYRIERTFGTEPKGDTFRLIDLATGKKSDRFSKEIGVELFQLDADSFERSTYMPQLHDQTGLTTAGIQAKLSDLVEDANDMGNYDKAVLALKAKRSTYIPYRGNGGSVAEAMAQVTRVQQELDRTEAKRWELTRTRQDLEELEVSLERKTGDIAAVRERITTASEAAAAEAVRKQYADLTARHGAVSTRLAYLREQYPMGLPTPQETEDAQHLADRLAALEAQQVTTPADREAADYLAANQARFAGSMPTSEQLENARQQCEAYASLTAQARQTGLTESEKKQAASLSRIFENGLTEASLDDLAAQNRLLLNQKAALAAMPPVEENASSLPVILAAVLGLAGSAAGAVLLVLRYFLPGGIVLGCGLMALIIAAVLGVKLRNTRAQITRQKQRLARMEEEAQQTEAQLQAALAPWFGQISDYDKAIARLRLARGQYLDLQAKVREAEQTHRSLTEQAASIEKELCIFLGGYYHEVTPERFSGLITVLGQEAADYRRAEVQVRQWRARKDAHEQEAARCADEISTFFEQFGMKAADPRRQLQQLRDDERAMADAAALEQQLSQQLAGFGPVPETPAVQWDLDSLKVEEARLNAEITTLTRRQLECAHRIEQLQRQVDQIPVIRDELQTWQETKTADQKKAKTLDETMEFLQRAKESLTTSYLGPIRENFAGYLEKLSGQKERPLVNAELEIQLERQGQAREMAYFSAGQTDLTMLCMRLALVDALFAEAKPFVILDDPFVNLDDDRTAEALALLKELGRDRQILYLTCSSSRSL